VSEASDHMPRHGDYTARFDEPAGPRRESSEELSPRGSPRIAAPGTETGSRTARFALLSAQD